MKQLLKIFAIVLVFLYGAGNSIADNNTPRMPNDLVTEVAITEDGASQIGFSDAYMTKMNAVKTKKNDRMQEDPICGTITVGTGGYFRTLAEAFDYVSNFGLCGDITLQIISNITESEMAYLTEWEEFGGSGYTLTVQPGGVGGWTISGSHGNELVVIDGASNVVINGCRTATGSARELTFANNGTNTYSNALVVGYADNVTVKNVIAQGPTRDLAYGIRFVSVTNGLIENNLVQRANYGIGIEYYCENIVITKNIIGTTSSTDQTNTIRFQGIRFNSLSASGANDGAYACDGYEISYNQILNMYNIGSSGAVNVMRGMLIGDGLNGHIFNNIIKDLRNDETGIYGVQISGYNYANRDLNVTFANNYICNMNSTAGYVAALMIHSQSDGYYFNNTIDNGTTTTSQFTTALIMHYDIQNVKFRNNILVNNKPGSSVVGITVYTATNPFNDLDYNCYYSNQSTFTLATNGATLAAWQSYLSSTYSFTAETHSTVRQVYFTATGDFHLDGSSVNDNALTCPIVNDVEGNPVNTDMDNEARNTNNNKMGCDVVTPVIGITSDITRYTAPFCQDESAYFAISGGITGFVDGISRNVTGITYTYNWYEDGSIINRENTNYTFSNNSLTVNRLADGNHTYQGEISLSGATVRSSISSVIVQAPIIINSQPAGAEACIGDETIILSIDAQGTISGYQWQMLSGSTWINIYGQTNSTMLIDLTEGAVGGWFRVRVTGPGLCPRDNQNASTVYSDPVQVVIHEPITNPHLEYYMIPGNICFGDDVYINAEANGTILGYQWQRFIGGAYQDIDLLTNETAQSKTLVILNTDESTSGNYRCIIYGSSVCNTVVNYTEELTLTVWKQFEIIKQPEPNVLLCDGGSIMLYVSVEGNVVTNDPYYPSYQWYKDGKPISLVDNPTANSSILMIENAKFEYSGAYHCEVFKIDCKGRGFKASEKSIVYVLAPVEITKHPQTRSANVGEKVTFEVKAHVQGAPEDYPIEVQWYKGTVPGTPLVDDGKYIQGAKSSMLSIVNIQNSHYSNNYYAVVTGKCGLAVSNYAALKSKPGIIFRLQPYDLSACEGDNAEFVINAESSDPAFTLKYQWKKDGINLVNDGHFEGVHESNLKIMGVEPTDIGSYECYVWIEGEGVEITSDMAALTMNEAPYIITQPEATKSVQVDDELAIAVEVGGTTPISYQWYKDDVAIDAAVDAVFVKTAELADAGTYKCLIKNVCNEEGIWSNECEVSVTTFNYSGIEETRVGGYSISANIPNPFATKTTINYSLLQAGNVRIIITDIFGKEISEIVNKPTEAGNYSIEVNTSDLGISSGIYYYSMIVNGNILTRKMSIIK